MIASMTRDESTIMIEYRIRIAVLEGTVNWMLSNGVFVKSIDAAEMEKIRNDAVKLVKRWYPDVEIEFKGK